MELGDTLGFCLSWRNESDPVPEGFVLRSDVSGWCVASTVVYVSPGTGLCLSRRRKGVLVVCGPAPVLVGVPEVGVCEWVSGETRGH